MPKFDWSPEQKLAIEEEGKNIIVSAGAGSGKTAVLTARVINKLNRGSHINELLVLTFTNAAAQEMKDRIRKSIQSTPGLEEELNLLDGAYITTFDSFSLSMVKKYHTRLNITNNITVTDEVVIALEKKKILEEILDEYYNSNNEKFNKLISDFCLKNDEEIKTYLENIYSKIELKFNKTYYLETFFDNEYTKDRIKELINEYTNILLEKIKYIKELLKELNEYFDGEYIFKLSDSMSNLLKAKTYVEIAKSVDIKLPSVPKNSPEEGKTIKSNISDIIKEIKALCTYSTTLEMEEEIENTKSNAEIIIEILKEYDKRLTKYKLDNEIFSFNDIARLAIQVVNENKDIRDELTNSFNEILVDEYQDTSDTQEMFISLISNNNVYMVGDIKQSIYRFRNANPYIFKNKYDTYRDNNELGLKIDLLNNFRSRSEVLSNINTIFNLIMDDSFGGADYKTSHRMIFGNKSYEKEGHTEQDNNLEILKYNKSDEVGVTKDEQEAFIIGKDIINKINSHYQVFDKEKKELRDVTFNDFVILLDRSKNFDLYKKIFEYLGIPLSILKEESIRKDNDILVIKNLFKLLISIKENKLDTDFKYSFISVARSFLFRLEDEEIFEYFVNNTFKESSIYIKLKELTNIIDITSPSEYIKYVLDELNYEEKLLTIGNIKSFRIRLEYIINLVKSLETNGNTIYDFIDYLEEIFNNDYDLTFNINKDNTNSTKIMTIHKSKGLEYHICYYAGLTAKFNTLELKEKIIFDNKYGLVISNVIDYYKDTIIKTLLKRYVKQEDISERIRLFYVALTRAKEKMIMVLPNIEEESNVSDIVPNYIREKYSSFYDIIKSIISNLEDYTKEVDVEITKDYKLNKDSKELTKNKSNLLVNELDINKEIIEEGHFSKDIPHLITKEEQALMDFGTKVHEVLELMDFKENNLDKFNVDDSIKDKINKFLNTELIKNNIDSNMYKEYEFIYNEDNQKLHGIIDLLIENEDKMIIVDYKLKNIDDSNYDKQLNGYRKYIMEKTNKETYCYLYSILDEKYREINYE